MDPKEVKADHAQHPNVKPINRATENSNQDDNNKNNLNSENYAHLFSFSGANKV